MTYVNQYKRRDGTTVRAHYRMPFRTSESLDRIWILVQRRRVTVLAESVATIATRLLPPQERARYAEEFQNELWTLAEDGESRRRQLVHAARLVWHAPRLYWALRSPHRRKASL